jgi:hypothetical protein
MADLKAKIDKIRELFAEEEKNPKKATKFGELPQNYESISTCLPLLPYDH